MGLCGFDDHFALHPFLFFVIGPEFDFKGIGKIIPGFEAQIVDGIVVVILIIDSVRIELGVIDVIHIADAVGINAEVTVHIVVIAAGDIEFYILHIRAGKELVKIFPVKIDLVAGIHFIGNGGTGGLEGLHSAHGAGVLTGL